MASEIELKFRVHPDFEPITLFGNKKIHPYKQKTYHHYYKTFYLDTEDNYAEELGISLRLRAEDDVPYIYAKTTISRDGALSVRKEWRIRSNNLETAADRLAFRGAPTKPLIGKKLYVTGGVIFDRMECIVTPHPGFSFILSYDSGVFDEDYGFGELEFELREGEIEELQALVEELRSEIFMIPEPRSKHQRSLEYAGGKRWLLPDNI